MSTTAKLNWIYHMKDAKQNILHTIEVDTTFDKKRADEYAKQYKKNYCKRKKLFDYLITLHEI